MSEVINKVLDLAKRRGIFWSSYEIYGGVAGFYDIGPIGVKIKNRIVELWRKYFIRDNNDLVVEIETPIIGPAKVFEASGHVESFTDPIVECKNCKRVYRADHLIEDTIKKSVEGLKPEDLTKIIRDNNIRCPSCGGELSEVRLFNLLFTTNIGPYTGNLGFLRPETAQGMFTAFKRVYETSRQRLPIGIAQIGRVARNEISPRQGLIRMREFTIMEVEFFIDPNDTDINNVPLHRFQDIKFNILTAVEKEKDGKPQEFKLEEAVREKIIIQPWMAYWMAVASNFVKALGINDFYFEEKLPYERAHYSKQTFDQIAIVNGIKVEISGHAYRGDYDLTRHMKFSGQDLTIFRKYDEPKIVKKKTLIINNVKLKEKELRKKVMELINNRSVEEVEQLIKNNVKIDDKPLSEFLSVVEREEKIHGEHFIPHVVEPSFGVERTLFLTVVNAYREKEGRVILSLPKYLAPYDIAVFPLLEKEELIKKSIEIRDTLSDRYDVLYDEVGSIGRRYARADEIGVPFAITVDPQTLVDNTVTIRDRDSWKQVRVKVNDLQISLEKLFRGEALNKIGIEVKDSNE
ncbi:glycine--tRNA ligase [Sulfolobus tengchongensis]|uniref:glycine--tRNA ligase n=1 Tax=Sulfolobus tengchongensis TaxID=207809 RepID=A0AAX4L1L6_9CREN